MPLRFQHQIWETMKECLPRKGKHILGVVNTQMAEKLRERMFTDTGVGTTDFEEKCLAVVRHLKLEAEILTKKHHAAIGEAAAKMHMTEVAQAKENSNPLV